MDDSIILSEMLTTLPYFVFWKDKDLVFRGCNTLFAEQFNYKTPQEIIGKTDADFPWSEEMRKKYRDDDLYVISTGKSLLNISEEQIQPDGSIKTLLVSKVPLKNNQNNIIGVFGAYADITYLKNVENALRREKEKAEAANRAKTEFLANMSHDVKTPLLSINILANSILASMDESNKKDAELILFCQKQLSTFFKNCLDNSSFELESPESSEESFSIQELFHEIYNLFITSANQKKLSLSLEIDDNAKHTVIGHRFILLRIIMNLVSNALKFTETGGIVIKVNSADIHESQIILKIAVQDTGMGIPEDKQKVIFERLARLAPAFSKRIEGSGIGLYIVDQYVKRMNGTIQVKSQLNEGSTFTVLIPLKRIHDIK